MKVPVYERRVAPGSLPSPDVSPRINPDAFGAGFAEKLGELGTAAQRAGAKLAYAAAKQQEEVDRAEFALLDAKADAYADELYMSESQNPDYEGTINRFKDGWRKYSEENLLNIPDRIREKARRLFEIKGIAYEGKFKGLFLKKQTDHLKRTLDDTVTVLVKNHDEQGLVRAIEGSTVLSEEQKGDMIRKGRRLIQVDVLEGLIRDNPDAEWKKEDYDTLDEGDWERIEDFRKRKQKERDDLKDEQEAQQFDELFGSIRRKKLGYADAKRAIDATGFSEKDKFVLFDLLDKTWEAGAFAKKGDGGGDGGGGRVKTDPETYWQLNDMVLDETLLEKYPDWKSFHKNFKGKLSFTDLKGFMSYYKKQDPDDDEPEVTFSRSSHVTSVMNDANIKDPKERAAFMARVNAEAKVLKKIKGKDLTDEEFIDLTAKLLEKKVLVKKPWAPDPKGYAYRIPAGAKWNEQLGGYVVFKDGKWGLWEPDKK